MLSGSLLSFVLPNEEKPRGDRQPLAYTFPFSFHWGFCIVLALSHFSIGNSSFIAAGVINGIHCLLLTSLILEYYSSDSINALLAYFFVLTIGSMINPLVYFYYLYFEGFFTQMLTFGTVCFCSVIPMYMLTNE